MDITRFAIEKNRITGVVMILIVFAGLQAYLNLPQAEDPGFVVRWANILTLFPGASPERVEQLVTDKLEKALQEMPELDFVASESRTGVSVVSMQMKDSFSDMRPIWDDMRRKVDKVRPELPDGVVSIMINDDEGDVFGVIVTIVGEGFSYAELKEVADEVRDELLHLDEVARVEIHGAQDEQIFVEYNNARLAELGLSPVQLQSILEGRNIIIPGGDVTTGKERIVLEPSGNFESVEDLRRTVIHLPSTNEVVYLQDLAHIHRGYVDPPSNMVRSSGEPSLALAVSMRKGGNIVHLGEQVREALAWLESVYPIGIEFDVVAFQPDDVRRKVEDFVSNLVQAVAIVLGVMLLTLGLRTGLLVAPLIPMAILMAFILMSAFGISLNQISIAALIIALGMLVDNAIVMSESIMVQIRSGKGRVEAAIDSARELRIPLLTSSLTTAAAFLPIYLAESEVGEYCADLFSVVTITLLSSWILTLTLTTLLCSRFMNVKARPETDPYDTKFYRAYRAFLLTLLRRPLVTVAAILLVFFVSMKGFAFIPFIFFPESDRHLFTADLDWPIGTPIEETETKVKQIDAFIASELKTDEQKPEGVENWSTFIGNGAPNFYLGYMPKKVSPEYAFMLANVTSVEVIPEMVGKLERFCNDNFPDLQPTIQRLSNGPPVAAPVAIRISGKDVDRLFAIMDEVKAELAGVPGTKNISDNWGRRSKKLLVNVNEPRALRAGVTNQDIAVSLQTLLSGFETTQFREDDKVIPVTMRSVAADRRDMGKLESLNIYSLTTGQAVPLKQVADIEVAWEPSKILRYDLLRTVTVSCYLEPGFTATEITGAIAPWLEERRDRWGAGYKYEFGGEMETSDRANRSIMAKLPAAGLIILLLLVSQFNSLRRPFIILMTIPLGMIGVVIGLLVMRSYFGFMTFLGVVSLAGIVINNAIVLLDRINIEIKENGLEPARAVVESAQRRLRPILLTTATTSGGLIPLYLGGGPMFETMAVAIMFGLLFATVLTLGFVPTLYSILFRVKFKNFKMNVS